MAIRRCIHCKAAKPLEHEHFRRGYQAAGDRRTECRECSNAYQREWRKEWKSPAEMRAYMSVKRKESHQRETPERRTVRLERARIYAAEWRRRQAHL